MEYSGLDKPARPVRFFEKPSPKGVLDVSTTLQTTKLMLAAEQRIQQGSGAVVIDIVSGNPTAEYLSTELPHTAIKVVSHPAARPNQDATIDVLKIDTLLREDLMRARRATDLAITQVATGVPVTTDMEKFLGNLRTQLPNRADIAAKKDAKRRAKGE